MFLHHSSPKYQSSTPARDATLGIQSDAPPQFPPIRLGPRMPPPAAPRAGRGLTIATGIQWGAHFLIRWTSGVHVEKTVRLSLVEIPSTPACASIPRDSRGVRFDSPAQNRQNDNSPWPPSRRFPIGVSWSSPSSSRRQTASCPRAFAPPARLEQSPGTSPRHPSLPRPHLR